MEKIFIALSFICLLASCSKEDSNKMEQLSLSSFQSSLKDDMDYNTIVKTFGEPGRDIGSGIHIYVYELSDSTQIWIGYSHAILYASHLDKESNLLNCLIGYADRLTYECFKQNLEQEMNYNTIVKTFGEPSVDIGSGIHIYVYNLTDGTEIWIGYADSIMYAQHIDQDKNIIHTLY